MKKIITLLTVLLILFIMPVTAFAADVSKSLVEANKLVNKAQELVQAGDIDKGKAEYDAYNKAWLELEDGVKSQSKLAYGDIEEKMGMVQFLFSQNPVQKDKVVEALVDLKGTNEKFINGKYENQISNKNDKNVTVKDLLNILGKAKEQIKNGDNGAALQSMNEFSSSWLDVEGVILTKSQKIYSDAEKDMVTAKAYLSMKPAQTFKAEMVIDRMYNYLSTVEGKNSYGIMDVITIILREGIEALLVVIALLGFIKKSGHEDKKGWIFGGVGVGLIVSIILAIIIKVLFTSGTFGNNNFLIAGWTGVFAAVMLIYVSYWLHSKSSAKQWNDYIKNKSTQAIATGSLFSLGLLAFLAVFREGTETVLFYIGMASSISLTTLISGIVLGALILVAIAFLILKVGLKIPMRPFFIVSSLLVFYLGIKFTGMGINGLQIAGILPTTTNDVLPTIDWLGVYPSLQSLIPQLILIVLAIAMVAWRYIKASSKK
ncbi:FTR1 family iron permease [Clostridium pasteurianum]|uniref:High-affinity Fe2+/Pb2+ permease n=1 Tax=Clostridium pasteurianum BC1 TaxID=86416 RepID=R4JZD7_CLOPA|nr:FTR1 family protein [Clostridium pasteurianum]AGK96192.1 high-affinity Fe2+/Pb2+ permease [Clostridium pasteurianum BC1]